MIVNLKKFLKRKISQKVMDKTIKELTEDELDKLRTLMIFSISVDIVLFCLGSFLVCYVITLALTKSGILKF